ncbi:MAG TPA: CRISPR-associated helicase Cas3' [Burkholderiaceae bacterium]|nr:CRISPR-associated helicase Cas3' [Burkholderiaceae bacterium]
MSKDASYFRYWGKAKPAEVNGPAYHLLPFHCLDVAAVAGTLLDMGVIRLDSLAVSLGLDYKTVRQLAIFFMVLHDLGKFSNAFQGLVRDLSPELVSANPSKHYDERHDTLGWLVWRDSLRHDVLESRLPLPGHELWAMWIKSAVGHHGMPPKEEANGGMLRLDAADYFMADDIAAARSFIAEVAVMFLPDALPTPDKAMREAFKRHSWQLAGLAVLADWLGSNQAHFHYYTDSSISLPEYWKNIAKPAAAEAVVGAGLAASPVRGYQSHTDLFSYLIEPTPLQRFASEVPLGEGAQLFLLEDVTGAGKTEAALILAHRMMTAGLADGIYFGLPSMATANQMYRRIGNVYRHFYSTDAEPSLILAHGARQLIDEFRLSVSQPADRNYQSDEPSATAQCTAWLADNRKKALLADVGVGTVDQALLAILPARHQSLRLLGLARKILVVDEVHAYDPYMNKLLRRLLLAHARHGGSAVLLSATLPSTMRTELVNAFQSGTCNEPESLPVDLRYPLITHVHDQVDATHCETRTQLRRAVSVQMMQDEAAVLAMIREQAAAGRCVCWIRNTVDDARAAYAALQDHIEPDKLMLFHSRYAMGDRLDIENKMLDAFGKTCNGIQRAGKVLIGTQVLEQSLDFDVDAMVSDLAPIDLLIQRAGRLQRHTRDADGNPVSSGSDQRPSPIFYVYGPVPTDSPAIDWYAAVFPKGRYVYPDAGRLWLTQKALLVANQIVTPGEPMHPAAVRELVEAVYGEGGKSEIPDSLAQATNKCYGEMLGEQSMADFNSLNIDKGYCRDSSRFWDEEARIPTRLGDETVTVFLAFQSADGLRPFIEADRFAWELSAVRLDAKKLNALSPEWTSRYETEITALRARHKLLVEPSIILPLEPTIEMGEWRAMGANAKGQLVEVRYNVALGLCIG